MLGRGVFLVGLCLTTLIVLVNSHGRLMDPAARNAMWRKGYPNPVNYNDNELYCGGFVVQYQKNKGKCGVCGDDFREKVPRRHEAGGEFGQGIIARRYSMGQVIDIEAELTTNHKGWMEVKLCPHNNPKEVITQGCLDRNPLMIAETPGQSGIRFVIPEDSKKVEIFRWKVKLPDGVTCSNCVLHWKYFAGNTWDLCEDGKGSVGCGNQETFINCADITINTGTGGFPSYPINNVDNPWSIYTQWEIDSTTGELRETQQIVDNPWSLYMQRATVIPGDPPMGDEFEQPSRPVGLIPIIVRSQLCIPIGEYKNMTGMDDWCRQNCLKYPPNCYPEVCRCVSQCDAIGEFAANHRDADIFCHQNCLGYPSHCPEEKCKCY
ncbi:unnamed protein product [Meganyctiphanes norvegica]|uniref:Chitin-binding type-4 domain-containing protein n=1 Tax=Meganyctiphanes norvegica TaxID=48144 RepID=A0AAV2PTJ8_MEGNR